MQLVICWSIRRCSHIWDCILFVFLFWCLLVSQHLLSNYLLLAPVLATGDWAWRLWCQLEQLQSTRKSEGPFSSRKIGKAAWFFWDDSPRNRSDLRCDLYLLCNLAIWRKLLLRHVTESSSWLMWCWCVIGESCWKHLLEGEHLPLSAHQGLWFQDDR
jgi:hypothetical protein